MVGVVAEAISGHLRVDIGAAAARGASAFEDQDCGAFSDAHSFSQPVDWRVVFPAD
jgi:hypothetical protein